MSFQVIWTKSALDDLNEILEEEYVDANGDNPLEKKAFYLASLLEVSPNVGETFGPLGKPYRHLILNSSYRLVYTVEKDQVFIKGLLPTRREFIRAWEERERLE